MQIKGEQTAEWHLEVVGVVIDMQANFMKIQRCDMSVEHQGREFQMGWQVLLPLGELLLKYGQSLSNLWIQNGDGSSWIFHGKRNGDLIADTLNLDVLGKQGVGRSGFR